VVPSKIDCSYLVKVWNVVNIETTVLIVVNDFPNLIDLINNHLKFLTALILEQD